MGLANWIIDNPYLKTRYVKRLLLLCRYGGVCDKDGCDFASYRLGDKEFYGPGKTVDTNKVMTVVTQFITDDGTDNGNLKEVRRFYVQDGTKIENSKVA